MLDVVYLFSPVRNSFLYYNSTFSALQMVHFSILIIIFCLVLLKPFSVSRFGFVEPKTKVAYIPFLSLKQQFGECSSIGRDITRSTTATRVESNTCLVEVA